MCVEPRTTSALPFEADHHQASEPDISRSELSSGMHHVFALEESAALGLAIDRRPCSSFLLPILCNKKIEQAAALRGMGDGNARAGTAHDLRRTSDLNHVGTAAVGEVETETSFKIGESDRRRGLVKGDTAITATTTVKENVTFINPLPSKAATLLYKLLASAPKSRFHLWSRGRYRRKTARS
jgi:hypothetical protein